jgi:acyl dehydratase
MRAAVQMKNGVRLAINYGLNKVRFPAPVRAGARVRARVTVLSANDLGDALEVTYRVMVEVEDEAKPCCVADWIVRYYQ